MALFKISKGESTNLPTTYNEGYCYVTTDERKMYIDTTNTAAGRIVLNASSADKLTTNAGSATNPIYFANGVPVATEYNLNTMSNDIGNSIKNLSVNGKVITYTKNNGDTDTITTQDTTYSAAGSSLGLVKSGGDVTISNGTITVNDDSHNHTIANVDNLQTTLDNKADKTAGIYYIEGPSTDTTAGAWTGSHDDITEYYNGLTIMYVPAIAGATTTTLDINGLGSCTCYQTNSTKLTTHYSAKTPIMLTYIDGLWKRADYNSDTKVTQNLATSSNYNYPVLLGYNSSTSKVTNVVNKAAAFTYNPSTGILSVPTISGTLSGNATTAGAFSAAKAITLSGDVTGTSSSTGGWAITTTLASTGVTAGSYGLSSNITPAFASSFNIPYVTVDAKGRVTSATTHTVTLPANPNSDTKVTNTLSTTTKAYITGTSTSTTNTGTQIFDTGVYLDTTAGTLTATTFKGTLSGNASTATTATKLGTTNVGTYSQPFYLSAGAPVAFTSTIGSATNPVYVSSGKLTTGTTYAGGTLVYLNNVSKAGTSATFYAPTTGGTSGQVLVASASTAAPVWTNQSALSVGSATKATQDANGNTITSTYETKTDATTKLNEAKEYADSVGTSIKNDLLNGAGAAYDTLKELGELIDDNTDAIDALETVAANKSEIGHTHKVTHTPAGTITAPTFTGTSASTTSITGTTTFSYITGVGSSTTLTGTVSNHCLTLTFTQGALPTTSEITVATATHTHSYKPAGTITAPTFSGTTTTITTNGSTD